MFIFFLSFEADLFPHRFRYENILHANEYNTKSCWIVSLRKPFLSVNGSSHLISVFIKDRSIVNHEKKESVDDKIMSARCRF